MCDYPAGQLVNGSLPGTEPGQVILDQALTRVGKLVKGGGTGAAAVFHCNQGGVSWPDHVVFYDRELKVMGHFDALSIGENSGRATVTSVTIHKRVVTLRVLAVGQSGDSDLWGSAGAKVTYKYDAHKKQMTRRSVTINRERATAKKLVKYVRAGKTKAPRTMADSATLTELRAVLRPTNKAWRPKSVSVGRCYGATSDDWVGQFLDVGQRGCLVNVDYPGEGSSVYLLVLGHAEDDRNWTRWIAVEFLGIAG